MNSKKKQTGMGIVEVLVALVVVSFGVLGMASMQLTGMKHSSGGYSRSKALLFAQNMTTRMRINTAVKQTFDYDNFDSDSISCNAPPMPYCQARPGVSGTAAECTPPEMANFDLYTVACGDVGSSGAEDGVIGTLPDGRLTVECLGSPCTADSAYQVSVTWSEGRLRSDDDTPDIKRVQVRLRP